MVWICEGTYISGLHALAHVARYGSVPYSPRCLTFACLLGSSNCTYPAQHLTAAENNFDHLDRDLPSVIVVLIYLPVEIVSISVPTRTQSHPGVIPNGTVAFTHTSWKLRCRRGLLLHM